MTGHPAFEWFLAFVWLFSPSVLGETTPPLTVAPQTAAQSGPLQTGFLHVSGLTTNSELTIVIAGTTTILPVWYCGPSETASVCKSCPPAPTAATSVQNASAACTSGFNALVLLPLAAVAGAFIPPPAGLPALTIAPDGPHLFTTPLSLPSSQTTTKPSSTSTSDISVSCLKPSYSLADFASPSQTTSSLGGGGPTIVPSKAPTNFASDPLPVLPMTDAMRLNPTNSHQLLAQPSQTAAIGCGVGSLDQYYQSGFYQFDNTFSRVDGLNAIRKFCEDLSKKKAILGPSGATEQGGDANNKAKDMYMSMIPVSNDKKITVRAIHNTENRLPNWQNCHGAGVPLFKFQDNVNNCFTLLGQTIDYCDTEPRKDSTDQSWKHGGTFYKDCHFWTVFLTPLAPDDKSGGGKLISLEEYKAAYPDWHPSS